MAGWWLSGWGMIACFWWTIREADFSLAGKDSTASFLIHRSVTSHSGILPKPLKESMYCNNQMLILCKPVIN